MPAQHPNTYLKCWLMLDLATRLFRNNHGEILFPQFGEKQFESKTQEAIKTLQKRSANAELVQYYLMAVNRKENNLRERRSDKTHRLGMFLLRYFRGEGQAIHYIEDLSITTIESLTNAQMDQIIKEKPIQNVWGPEIKWKDEMWYHIYRRSLCWVFCEDIELLDALPVPFVDLDDCYYEPIEPSPGNPFGIEPDYVEWMDEDDFTYY
jgi:hypothetical protein